MLKKDILKKHGISSIGDLKELLPNTAKFGNLVVTEGSEIGDNGSIPSQVSRVSKSGSKISWGPNPDNDVIGYRVYAAANFSTDYKKVASIHASSTLAITVGTSPAAYYIVAVDVAGKESPPSAIIKLGEYADKKPKPAATGTDKPVENTTITTEPSPPTDNKPDTPQAPTDTTTEAM
jgi:penicillin-binding protein